MLQKKKSQWSLNRLCAQYNFLTQIVSCLLFFFLVLVMFLTGFAGFTFTRKAHVVLVINA